MLPARSCHLTAPCLQLAPDPDCYRRFGKSLNVLGIYCAVQFSEHSLFWVQYGRHGPCLARPVPTRDPMAWMRTALRPARVWSPIPRHQSRS